MDYVEKLLAQGERIVFVTRRHWLAVLPTILVDVGVAVVILAFSLAGALLLNPFSALALLLLLAPLAHFLARLNAWRNEQYIVTNRRVMEVRGVLKKYVSDSSLQKINDVIMEQSALGRLLGYGDVRIITGSDVGVDAFRRIARPVLFKTAMLNQMSPPGEDERFVPEDVPRLLDRLDDLRRRGVISEEEFRQEKQQLLERL